MLWLFLQVAFVLFAALAVTVIVALWVYGDAKTRGERGWLWVCIVVLASPILGGLLYLLARRDERKPCRFCGWMVERSARFCSHCGREFPLDPDSTSHEPRTLGRRSRRFLAALILSFVLMVAGLVGVIVTAVTGAGIGTDIEWNTGWVMMNVENTWDNVWNFRYNIASEDYHTGSNLQVEDPQNQQLQVQLQFEQGESMRMTITQGEREEEYHVQSMQQAQYFPLDGFAKGKIRVRFYNNGVLDVKAQVTVVG